MTNYVLTVSCKSTRGIVAAITGYLAEEGCYITDSSQFDDMETGLFFMRLTFISQEGASLEKLRAGFEAVKTRFGMDAEIRNSEHRMKVLLMVSRFGHCLNDLLYRWKIGALPIDIVGVISNHFDYQKVVVNHDIPFHHIPVTKANKQQAYERGVKLIGATAHYVTADLDEGPIIEQDIARITHAQSAEDYVSIGRDVESQVLARAVHAHIHHRTFINGNRTVVFPASPGSYASERMG